MWITIEICSIARNNKRKKKFKRTLLKEKTWKRKEKTGIEDNDTRVIAHGGRVERIKNCWQYFNKNKTWI